MIANPHRLPYLIWKNARLLPLSEPWLTESIAAAAERAGYPAWDLAPHVARAVSVFLEEEFNRNTITLPQLNDMLVRSLEDIGYADVADCAEVLSPRVSVSLLDVARSADIELCFFPNLAQKIDEALGYEAPGILFHQLRHCVKWLQGRKRWQGSCDDLGTRIVSFIRHHLARNQACDLRLMIS